MPSENFVFHTVIKATGSVLSNKYSEGYPNRRYYQGNDYVDSIERAKKLFNSEHADVQPYYGSTAKADVFMAFLNSGDTFLGFDLSCGGHHTHGSHVNFSGKIYKAVNYSANQKTKRIDLDTCT